MKNPIYDKHNTLIWIIIAVVIDIYACWYDKLYEWGKVAPDIIEIVTIWKDHALIKDIVLKKTF